METEPAFLFRRVLTVFYKCCQMFITAAFSEVQSVACSPINTNTAEL